MQLTGFCRSCGQPLDHVARLWRMVEKDAATGCWNFTGIKGRGGYGKFTMNNIVYPAHRVAYTIVHGPIPKHDNPHMLHIGHRCNNRGCINPEHLYLCSAEENMRYRSLCGRNRDQRGEKHNLAKLTNAQVEEIRRRVAAGEMQKTLAEEFGISKAMTSLIINGKNWAHVGGGVRPTRQSRAYHPRLTKSQVIAIRQKHANGAKYQDLADEYGVTDATIGHIVTRLTWSHIE